MSLSSIPRPDQLSISLPTSSSHIHQPIPRSPPKYAQIEPSFICTICWQPQYAPSEQSLPKSRFGPKLLGTSARIVCHACWCAVLDLSICWVCGECVLRGDDVISLGWCFWHRGCFGCLICGTKIAPPSNDDDEIPHRRKWKSCDGSDCGIGESRKRKRCAGIELEEIPLCAVCEQEVGGESQSMLRGRGLETVSKVDGGLSRSRLERFSEQQAELKVLPRQLARRPRRVKGATGIESELGRFINRSSTTSGNASDTCFIEDRTSLMMFPSHGISDDGSFDKQVHEQHNQVANDKNIQEQQPTVYVSVFDPIGDPPFTPSPTKPLPIWMSLLPSNVHKARVTSEKLQNECPDSKLSQEFINRDLSQASNSELESTESSRSCDGSNSDHDVTPSEERSGIESDSVTTPIDIPIIKRRAATSISFKREELDESPRASRRSQTMESTFGTRPDFSTKPPQYRRHPTPFPRITSPEIEREDASCYFNQSVNASPETVHSPETIAGMMMLSQMEEHADSASPNCFSSLALTSPALPNSSEYLDRYRPQSPTVLPRQYVPLKAESIMEKLKKQRSERKSLEQAKVVSEAKKSEVVVRSQGGEGGVDLKRKEMRNELKDLFYEK